jgi:hypothetical protein
MFFGKNYCLLVVEVIVEVLVNGLQLLQHSTILVVAEMLKGESMPCRS